VLRTIGPGSQVLGEAAANVTLFDPSAGAGGITLDAMADYFDQCTVGISAETIKTTSGVVQAGAVLLSKQWIGRLEIEAAARARVAAGLQQIAPESFATGGAQPAGQNQRPVSGSDPQCLALLQEQHRQAAEQQAARELNAAQQENASLRHLIARLQAENSQTQWAKHEADNSAEQYRREAQEERRSRVIAEERLHELAGVIAFMNEENPLSPVEGRRAVTAWCDLTDNGQMDPTDVTGIGVGELARRWWLARFGEPKNIVAKHLQWVLAWPARKKGGAVAKKNAKKG